MAKNFYDNNPQHLQTDENFKFKVKSEPKIIQEDEPTGKNIFDPDAPNVINLSDEDREYLERTLYEELEDSLSRSNELFQDLREFEMIYNCEPNPENDDLYFIGSSNIRTTWGRRSLKNKIVRWMSMFGLKPYVLIDPLRYKKQKKTPILRINPQFQENRRSPLPPIPQPVEQEEAPTEKARNIEEYCQHLFEKLMDGVGVYRNILTNTGKQNTGLAMLSWDRKYNKIYENNVIFNSVDEFKEEFPEHTSAGISEDDYKKIISDLKKGEPITIPKIQSYKLEYNKPKLQSINRDNFFLIPHNATNLEETRGYAYCFDLNWNDLIKGEAEGRYNNIERVKTASVTDYERNRVDYKRYQQAGIQLNSEDTDYDKKTYKIYKIIYHYDIDGDNFAEKIILTYCFHEKVIIRAEIWDDNLVIIPHYCEHNPGMFDGIGIIKTVKPINDHGDEIWNLRNNAAKIVCSPSFKVRESSGFDPTIQEWMPGVCFFVKEMNDFQQIPVTNNFPELYNEEILLDKYVQEETGITSGHSGGAMAGDPGAPGNKYITALMQGNMITNDEISCLRPSIEKTFYWILRMCAKYLDDDDKYLEMFNLTKEDLKLNLDEISLYNIDMSYNSEIRKRSELMFYQTYRQEPMIAQNPNSVRKLLRSNFSVWDKDKQDLLPTEEELREQQIQVQMEAMRRMELEKVRASATTQLQRSQNIPPPPPRPSVREGEGEDLTGGVNIPSRSLVRA